jgi:hypothetical protein
MDNHPDLYRRPSDASLRTLNINPQYLDASTGTTTQKPAFPDDIANRCSYDFANYVVGLKDPAITFQQLTAADKAGTPAQIQQSRPLFSKFIVDANNGQCNSNNTWFGMVYTKPDVALNYPARWDWNRKDETVGFYSPDPSQSPIDQEFYWMRGFFHHRCGESRQRASTRSDERRRSAGRHSPRLERQHGCSERRRSSQNIGWAGEQARQQNSS